MNTNKEWFNDSITDNQKNKIIELKDQGHLSDIVIKNIDALTKGDANIILKGLTSQIWRDKQKLEKVANNPVAPSPFAEDIDWGNLNE